MEDQPDQTTLSMRNDPDGLIMSEALDATAIDDLENASFDFYGGVSSLIEQAPHVTVALRRAVTVVHAGALFFARAGTDPRREAFSMYGRTVSSQVPKTDSATRWIED